MAPTTKRQAAPLPKPSETFPAFTHDGDVKLVVTGARQYQLHSNVLRNNSPVLRDLLDSVDPAPLSNKLVKSGHVIRHKLMLVHNPDRNGEVQYVFTAVALDSLGRAIHGNPAGIGQDLEGGKIVSPTILAYNTVLAAFYNVPVELGDAQDDGLSHLLSQALAVTSVAEYLECIHIITPPIESTLLATGQSLYRAIGANPCAWLSFAYRIRSKVIFKEALIHAAGQYYTPKVSREIKEANMPEEVMELLQTKSDWIKASVKQAERHLASYYPSTLMRQATLGRVDRDNIGRANYANDIMMWIALSVFRHWCCDMMASDQTHNAEDMGFTFMQVIYKGGNEYMSKKVLQEQFHCRFPMSPKGMACVEHRLAEIKEVVKQWAEPLLVNNAALDTRNFPIPNFTCVNVLNKDYPWVVDRDGANDEDLYSEEDGGGNDDDDSDGGVPLPRETPPDDEDPDSPYLAAGSWSFPDSLDPSAADVPELSFGRSFNRGESLDAGDIEDDTADPEVEDDDEGRLGAVNALAHLHRTEAPDVSMGSHSFESMGGDTEPELDQSYQEPHIAEARRRAAEFEGVSSQGEEAQNEYLDREIIEAARESRNGLASRSEPKRRRTSNRD